MNNEDLKHTIYKIKLAIEAVRAYDRVSAVNILDILLDDLYIEQEKQKAKEEAETDNRPVYDWDC